MKVQTTTGTNYDFRLRVDGQWEGIRYNTKRQLHCPIADWTIVRLETKPTRFLSLTLRFEGEELWITSPITTLEMSEAEEARFPA